MKNRNPISVDTTPVIVSLDTETSLTRMKKLATQIKVLQAEYDMLKSQNIETYFADHEEYRTNKGLLLASYKGVMVSRFQQSRFKENHPKYFDMFCEEKMEYKFLLK